MGRIRDALIDLKEMENKPSKVDELKTLHETQLDEIANFDDAVAYARRDAEDREPQHWLYVATAANRIQQLKNDVDSKICKIGYSNDVDRRMDELTRDTGNRDEVTWYAKFPINSGADERQIITRWNDKKFSDQAENDKLDKLHKSWVNRKNNQATKLDNLLHDIIDMIDSSHMTYNEYIRQEVGSAKGIDEPLRTTRGGHESEWYCMSPDEGVKIVQLFRRLSAGRNYGGYGSEVRSSELIGEPIFNETHPYKGHFEKPADGRGKKLRADAFPRTPLVNGWGIGVASTSGTSENATVYPDLHNREKYRGVWIKYNPKSDRYLVSIWKDRPDLQQQFDRFEHKVNRNFNTYFMDFDQTQKAFNIPVVMLKNLRGGVPKSEWKDYIDSITAQITDNKVNDE